MDMESAYACFGQKKKEETMKAVQSLHTSIGKGITEGLSTAYDPPAKAPPVTHQQRHRLRPTSKTEQKKSMGISRWTSSIASPGQLAGLPAYHIDMQPACCGGCALQLAERLHWTGPDHCIDGSLGKGWISWRFELGHGMGPDHCLDGSSGEGRIFWYSVLTCIACAMMPTWGRADASLGRQLASWMGAARQCRHMDLQVTKLPTLVAVLTRARRAQRAFERQPSMQRLCLCRS